jgi:multisubunit Na+/H+ antiporter MnhF subunit
VIAAASVALLLAAGLFGYRLLRGPTLADRVVAVDGLLIVGISAVVIDAARRGAGTFLPVAVVTTMIGYISTAVVARFIERRATAAEDAR